MQPCLDEALSFVWRGMKPLPEGMVVIDGTAIALYFNHIAATDLDWLDTTYTLNESKIYRLTSFDAVGAIENLRGGRGAIDCLLVPSYDGARNIAMNFVEPSDGFIAGLGRPPILASDNGIPLAHPADLVRMKLMALFSRRAYRDYHDIGMFAEREPDILKNAVDLIVQAGLDSEFRLAATLASAPQDRFDQLPPNTRKILSEFSVTILGNAARR